MKCKICGHRTNTIAAMRTHYFKKHKATMVKRMAEGRASRKSKGSAHKLDSSGKVSGFTHCPFCGKRLPPGR